MGLCRGLLAGAAVALIGVGPTRAGIELVSLPARSAVELTIYREVDLTLVRERRTLTFRKGMNRLEFSWAGTLIDSTSLELRARDEAGGFEVLDSSYPPRVAKTLVWTVADGRGGPREVEISYFTSGVSWMASYQVVASPDGASMDLEGDVRLINNSGEDFEQASVRLVVGHVNLVETIAELARRNDARELSPATGAGMGYAAGKGGAKGDRVITRTESRRRMVARDGDAYAEDDETASKDAKEIMKEGLADYFLFSVPGTETLKNGWTLRLPSIRAGAVPYTLLYRADAERYGDQLHGLFKLANTEASKLGNEPLPEGDVQVFRKLADGRLAFVGRSHTKYIPVGEKVELDLGSDPDVVVEERRMANETGAFAFDSRGNVQGWDVTWREEVQIRSGKAFAIEAEVLRHFPTPRFTLAMEHARQKVDADTIKVVSRLAPGGRESYQYTLVFGEGSRADVRR